jgi:hypothetical protein
MKLLEKITAPCAHEYGAITENQQSIRKQNAEWCVKVCSACLLMALEAPVCRRTPGGRRNP